MSQINRTVKNWA